MGLRIAGPAYTKYNTMVEISDNRFRYKFTDLMDAISWISNNNYPRQSIEYDSFRIFNSSMINPLKLFGKPIKYDKYYHIKRYSYMNNERIIKGKGNNNITLNDWYFTPVDIDWR